MVSPVSQDSLVFDSFFEGGNLDLVLRGGKDEYDLYMRTDSNTRGHHQWFYFSAVSSSVRTVVFHVLNFTKRGSLFSQGMRVAVLSEKQAERAEKGLLPPLYKAWHKGGDKITYTVSKTTQELPQRTRKV